MPRKTGRDFRAKTNRAFVRAFRAARRDLRAWRARRRDSRLLAEYEPEVRHLDDAWRGEL